MPAGVSNRGEIQVELAGEPRCTLSTEDPLEPIVVQGRARRITDRGALETMLAAENAKYGTDHGLDMVDPSSWVFIVAQGLLMYLEPEAVRQLLAGIADRFPGAELVFDVVPRWFSHLTLLGLYQTPHYRLPPMPWGDNLVVLHNFHVVLAI